MQENKYLYLVQFKNDNDIIVTAKCTNQVVATLGAWIVLDEIQINDVFVKDLYRRQGIASVMLNRLFEFGKERNCKKVTLEVREGNVPARKLYEKLGFHQVGERKNYYQDNNETAILMDAEL